jgi:hypothetical protein
VTSWPADVIADEFRPTLVKCYWSEYADRVHALNGYNFEDSILIERVVAEDRYTSIHMKNCRDGATQKLGS